MFSPSWTSCDGEKGAASAGPWRHEWVWTTPWPLVSLSRLLLCKILGVYRRCGQRPNTAAAKTLLPRGDSQLRLGQRNAGDPIRSPGWAGVQTRLCVQIVLVQNLFPKYLLESSFQISKQAIRIGGKEFGFGEITWEVVMRRFLNQHRREQTDGWRDLHTRNDCFVF